MFLRSFNIDNLNINVLFIFLDDKNEQKSESTNRKKKETGFQYPVNKIRFEHERMPGRVTKCSGKAGITVLNIIIIKTSRKVFFSK